MTRTRQTARSKNQINSRAAAVAVDRSPSAIDSWTLWVGLLCTLAYILTSVWAMGVNR